MTDEKHFLCRVERLTIGSEVFQWNALGNCPLPLPVSICTTDEEIEMAPLQVQLDVIPCNFVSAISWDRLRNDLSYVRLVHPRGASAIL